MLPPNQRSIPELVKEEGIAEPTLYAWRTRARNEGRLMPDSNNTPEGWSSRDKFSAVLETATMSQAEIAETTSTQSELVQTIQKAIFLISNHK